MEIKEIKKKLIVGGYSSSTVKTYIKGLLIRNDNFYTHLVSIPENFPTLVD